MRDKSKMKWLQDYIQQRNTIEPTIEEYKQQAYRVLQERRILDLVQKIKNKTITVKEITEFLEIGFTLYKHSKISYPEFQKAIDVIKQYRHPWEVDEALQNAIYNYQQKHQHIFNPKNPLDSVNVVTPEEAKYFYFDRDNKYQLYTQPTKIQNSPVKEEDITNKNDYKNTETDLDQRGRTMLGRDYLRDGKRNYTHMRAMLERLWNNTRAMPSQRFTIDDRFNYDRDALARYITTSFSPYDIDQAHRECVNVLRKRGRPEGAKNKPRPTSPDPMLDNLPTSALETEALTDEQLLDELTKDQPKVESTTSTPHVSHDMSAYVKHIELRAQLKDYATQIDVAAFVAESVETIKSDIAGALRLIQAKQARTIKIENVARPELSIDLGLQHEAFAKLLKACCAVLPSGNRLIPWVYGPAGTGKSYGAEMVAKALGLQFYSMGTTLAKFEVLGFINTSGYQRTPFRDAYENGGVFCGDEMDSWSKEATIALNNALANGACAFPDATIKRHKDFVMVATANTIGNGATLDYVARTKQDAATMDRFGAKVFWCLDEVLEDNITSNKEWLAYVRQIRKAVERSNLNPKPLITPRMSIHGSALLDAGLEWNDVVSMTVKAGLTETQWEQLQRNIY